MAIIENRHRPESYTWMKKEAMHQLLARRYRQIISLTERLIEAEEQIAELKEQVRDLEDNLPF